MSKMFQCDDKARLVAYLYDDLGEDDRCAVDDHLRTCPACAGEVRGLRDVRAELAAWAPPDVDLGFAVVPAADTSTLAPTPRRWWQAPVIPAWAHAAAALLLLSAGLSILNLRVHYGPDGLTITTGWLTPASAPAATSVAQPPASADDAPWRQELAALERTLRGELTAARAEAASAPAAGASARDLSAARVAALIEQSERRQRQELALRLAQFGRDLEVQRRSDLVRINQGLGQFEGRAGAEILRQRQMLDYIMRVSAQPPQ